MDIPKPTDDITRGKTNLDEFGITVHPNFLSSGALEALRYRLEEQAEMERELGVASFAYGVSEESGGAVVGENFRPYIGRPVGLPPFQAVTSLANKGRVFIELAKHPAALQYAAHAFRGIPFNVGYQDAAIIRKGAPAQPVHIDQQPVPFPTPVPLSINVMVALGDFEAEMGATRMVPGSHKRDIAEAGEAVETIPAVLEPGSAMVWESRVWHAQGASQSDNTRWSVATLYAVHFLKPPENFPAALHDEVYSAMSEEERRLYDFGFVGYGGRLGPRSRLDMRGNVGDNVVYIPELHRNDRNRPEFLRKARVLSGRDFGRWNE
jgi:hypothetical protein